MRVIRVPALVTGLALVAAAALAAPGTTPEPPTQRPADPTISSTGTAAVSGPRAEAEKSYALAYEEVAKAKKHLEAGKDKNAQKMFKRALERVEGAVALDPTYHEAWNLLGYSARKLGDYDKAFSAYEKCLEIKADYAPAREYLGEARLEKGDVTKAREQLALLERLNAESPETVALRASIDKYVAAHPEAATTETAKVEAVPASTDSVKADQKR